MDSAHRWLVPSLAGGFGPAVHRPVQLFLEGLGFRV